MLTVLVDFIRGANFCYKPKHLTSGSVGSDLFSTKTYLLYPNKATLIDYSLHMQIPKGYCGLISGRSSLALKCIVTHVGLIDNDYAGSVGVILINVACYPTYEIPNGDRIGQITILKCERVSFNEGFDFDMKAYGEKLRMGGFGSTGK